MSEESFYQMLESIRQVVTGDNAGVGGTTIAARKQIDILIAIRDGLQASSDANADTISSLTTTINTLSSELDAIEAANAAQDIAITAVQGVNSSQASAISAIEALNAAQAAAITAVQEVNATQATEITKLINSVASIVIPEPPAGSSLTEEQVTQMIADSLLVIQNPGSPPGVVINVNVASGNATVSSGDFATADTLQVINATASGRIVDLPATAGSVAIVSAATNTRTVTIRRGTSTYQLARGGFVIVYLDGTANYMRVLAASTAPHVHAIADVTGLQTILDTFVKEAYVPGLVNDTTDNVVFALPITADNAFTLPAGAAGCVARALNQSTDTVTLNIENGSGAVWGTITFTGAGAVTGTWTVTTNRQFTAGTTFLLRRTLPWDASLDRLLFLIKGTRIRS